MIRRTLRPSSIASAAILVLTHPATYSQVATDPAPLTAALPEQRGFSAQDADLFLPFTAIPGAPEAAPEPVTPELRRMIDEALEEPLMGRAPEPRPPAQPVDPRLLALATQTAGRVVGLRVWDGYGEEIARGCGCFISASGDVLTDLSLVRPERARAIEYITVLTGSGERHRVTGFRWQDERSGLAILTTDAAGTPFLTLQTRSDFSSERPVRILAYHEERGVVLADAFAHADASRSGEGWLNLRGEDSSGEPGSPVIDDRGEAVGMVALRVPARRWVNFGVSLSSVAGEIESALKLPLRPLARLATSSGQRISTDERFLTAFQNLHAGRIRSAVTQLLYLRQRYPRSAEVWALLGLACARAGAAEEARNCNRKAVALDPTVGQYWYQLGLDHSELADPRERSAAIEALQRTVEQRPSDVPAWLLLAERQVVEGQFREAEKSLLQLIRLRPEFAHALYLLSYSRAKLGDYSGAELAIRECLRQDRKNGRAWFYLGLLLTKGKRFPEAVDALRETVSVAPSHPHAWLNLAVLQRRMGRVTDAALSRAQHQRVLAAKE